MRKTWNFTLWIYIVFALAFLGSCNNGSETEDVNNDTIQEHSEKEKHEVHWSYEGETGPEHWAEIVPDCDCGAKAQSPIDISGDIVDKDFSELKLDYQVDSTLEIVNNGHSIKVDYPNGTFMVEDVEYKLAQFHFHTASEHTLKGNQYPLEAHLVHLSADEKIAVIGIWFEEGEENVLLKKVYDKLPDETGETISESLAIDVKNLLPEKKTYYHYTGSLTTPPCTEGVNWFVMKNPNHASKEQIEKLAKLMPANNFRPIQALNGREIEVYD